MSYFGLEVIFLIYNRKSDKDNIDW